MIQFINFFQRWFHKTLKDGIVFDTEIMKKHSIDYPVGSWIRFVQQPT